MLRFGGCVLLTFLLGCDAEIVIPPPPDREPAPVPRPEPGPNEPEPEEPEPQPSYRTLDVHLVRSESGAPAQAVEVLSHDVTGAMIERLQTDGEGYAAIDIENGGTVSILWEDQISIEDPVRFVSTFRVTPGLETLNRALQGLRGDPNPPIEVVLDVEEVPGATQYVAQLSCAPQIITAAVPIVVSGYTGCEGQKSFSATVHAGDADGVYRWAALSGLPLPDNGSVTQTLSPAPIPKETFTITLLGMPAESYAFASFERSTEGLHGPSWQASDGWTDGGSIEWTGELSQLELPVQVAMYTSFRVSPDCVRTVRRDGFTGAPTSFSWTPDRLASGTIVDGAIQLLGEGDPPDIAVIRFGGGDGGEQPRVRRFLVPWTPEEQGPVPTVHIDLPADLEDLYGIEGEPISVGSLDVLDAVGYEAALASDPRGLTESATSRDCAR